MPFFHTDHIMAQAPQKSFLWISASDLPSYFILSQPFLPLHSLRGKFTVYTKGQSEAWQGKVLFIQLSLLPTSHVGVVVFVVIVGGKYQF